MFRICPPDLLLPNLAKILGEKKYVLELKVPLRIECFEVSKGERLSIFKIGVEDRLNGRVLEALQGAILEPNKALDLNKIRRVLIAEFVSTYGEIFLYQIPKDHRGNIIKAWAKGPLKTYFKNKTFECETLDNLVKDFVRCLSEVDVKLKNEEEERKVKNLKRAMGGCTKLLSKEEVLSMWEEVQTEVILGE